MKIVKKGVMPNGVKIQLEDWREDYPGVCEMMIGAYPIAKQSDAYRIITANRRFRLTISANVYANYTNEEVVSDFDSLISGKKSLEDLAEHFWNGDADKWHLGMFTPDTDEWYEARVRYGDWRLYHD